ncbi:timeless-domain-containing protein [Coniophora puteana RWD-64-598 SS2]|uniref:Timeless-domain-containing protein n=1 Tax=Coniophora puteana (strain RWD-64-598) TaxID=741705 RepID=A0A5M3MLD6_CONPW|nr:timeless-domain-containing protein [Coniophora puteana RWD-64-598 SS2]EIW79780.1 timeless-domain-containing protein [Coniophora puteana RWD-64-598 SS2]
MDDIISVHGSDSEELQEEQENVNYVDRKELLEPVVRRVVDALGGPENGVYRPGDEALGCLRDLKRLWRTDDSDDDRTVARLLFATRLLPNDLVPLLLLTAGKGNVEDPLAIACADLATAMTWPIDIAEELREVEDDEDVSRADYTQLTLAHLVYKSALLTPGVIQALFNIILLPISKPSRQRTERESQVVNVVFHLFRNLAFIRDLPADAHRSGDQTQFSTLQSRYIKVLSETHVFDLFLTIAANTGNDPLFNSVNTLVLETFYLLFRSVRPSSLAADQQEQPKENLRKLLAAEDKERRELARNASSRHSRFGTTISVKLNPKKQQKPPEVVDLTVDGDTNSASTQPQGDKSSRPLVLHRQAALTQDSGAMLDATKRIKWRKAFTVDELARQDTLDTGAKSILRGFAGEFVKGCFNPFLASLLKDIKSERAKITEKDHLRLLFVTKWLLDFFLSSRTRALAKGTNQASVADDKGWQLPSVAEVTDRAWIVWVLRRMRESMEDKPKAWTELQAGIECLTQLLLLVDAMLLPSPSAASDANADVAAEDELRDAAEALFQQLVYNGEVLDIALDALRAYKGGTQSLAYLGASVHLAHQLLRMLEKWGKSGGNGVYVRKRKARKRKGKGNGTGVTEEEGVPDVEDVEEGGNESEEAITETMFTFEAFEMKFASPDIARTLLAYLARYRELDASEGLRRVVGLIHRQAVKAKAEGLFFNVSTLSLFKAIHDDQRSLPKDQTSKDLIQLISFILRRFFKALAEEPMLAVEAFFPMNRGHWKQFSSWEPEKRQARALSGSDSDNGGGGAGFPAEVKVKKGYSWSEQIGIVIAALVEEGNRGLVEWIKDVLFLVIRQRRAIVEETDLRDKDNSDGEGEGDEEKGDDGDAEKEATRLAGPSAEAVAKFEDYRVPYIHDEQAQAATKNPRLKLMLELLEFTSQVEEGTGEVQWIVPAKILPAELQSNFNVIDQYLREPLDLAGKKASELLAKKARRRRRRRRALASDEEELPSDEEEPRRRRRAKKEKEEKQYKSAQFIEDSDGEDGEMDAFLEREKALRDRMERVAADSGKGLGTMRATGTKKRRRRNKNGQGGDDKKRGGKRARTADPEDGVVADGDADADVLAIESSASNSDDDGAEPDAADDVLDALRRSKSPERPTARAKGKAKAASPPRPKPRPRPRLRLSKKSAAPTSDEDMTLDEAAPNSFVKPASKSSQQDNDSPPGSPIPERTSRRRVVVISDDEE